MQAAGGLWSVRAAFVLKAGGGTSPAGSRGRLAWAADNPPGGRRGEEEACDSRWQSRDGVGLVGPAAAGRPQVTWSLAGDQGPGQPRTLRDWPPSTGDRASGRVSSSSGGGWPPWGRLVGCAFCPGDADGTQGPDLDEARGPPRPQPAQASSRPGARMRGGCQADLKLLLPTIR